MEIVTKCMDCQFFQKQTMKHANFLDSVSGGVKLPLDDEEPPLEGEQERPVSLLSSIVAKTLSEKVKECDMVISAIRRKYL
jgi:hypothetical protein